MKQKRLLKTKPVILTHLLAALCFIILAGCSTAMPPEPNAEGSGNVAEPTDVFIDTIEIAIMESFPVQVSATVSGNLANGCVTLNSLTPQLADNTFTIVIDAERGDGMCTQMLVPFNEVVTLPVNGLAAGTYSVRVGEQSADFTLDMDNQAQDDNGVAAETLLAGSAWQWVSGQFKGEPITTLSDVAITIAFTADQVNGSAGCNRYFATYTQANSQIAFDGIGATRKGCAKPLMLLESQFLAALESAESFSLTGSTLQLQLADGDYLDFLPLAE